MPDLPVPQWRTTRTDSEKAERGTRLDGCRACEPAALTGSAL